VTKTYVITGANRGLGLELVTQIIQQGDTVIGGVRDPTTASALSALPVRIHKLDITCDHSIAHFVQRVQDQPVDVLINNAGIAHCDPQNGRQGKRLKGLERDELLHYYNVNSIGPLLLTQNLIPNLRMGVRKLIVNMSSDLASISMNRAGQWYEYRASKVALNMLTCTLASELKGEGFTCICMHPGWVRTEMGGSDAPLSVTQSVTGMLAALERVTALDNGQFLDYTDSRLPW